MNSYLEEKNIRFSFKVKSENNQFQIENAIQT